MNTYTKCTKFPPVRGRVVAVLIAAFLATLSVATAVRASAQAQAPQPSSPAIVWIVTDPQSGNRTVYHLGADGSAIPAGNLGPASMGCPAGCVKVFGGCLC
jgi:hypothetical protein